MPGFDGTGPMGRGPGTGGGFGVCRGSRFYPGGSRRGGFGCGPGWGRSWGLRWGPCHWWSSATVPYYGPAWSGLEEEKAFLKEQKEQLKAEMAEMEKRMAELEEAAGSDQD